MKKIILLAVIALSLFSCSSEELPADNRGENIESPKESPYPNKEMVVIGKYKITAGWMYVYRIDSDTIYVVEGKSSSFPVSIQIK